MKIEIQHLSSAYEVDLDEPIDLSLALENDSSLGAWYLDPPKIEAVRSPEFIGEVSEGSPVNFRNIHFNPHAHTTHTESLAHISTEDIPVNGIFSKFHFIALLLSFTPKMDGQGNQIIFGSDYDLKRILDSGAEALIIRTIPNESDKKLKNYSHANPPYLDLEFVKSIRDLGIDHLLIDLPSIDAEEDGGLLLGHHAFWGFPNKLRPHASISEFIFVRNEVEDGLYWMNLVPANIKNDAAISRPILYRLNPK
ncbi:MAG TPA: metal-dependent hydrolase [Flavobacteriales bacterium]|jgi:kynurenine formamidase|nr:cyclase family protein [Salibacteraceae bacterium]HAS34927.1 metal-dependent hydrolase [Flavobacteriales bacterium]